MWGIYSHHKRSRLSIEGTDMKKSIRIYLLVLFLVALIIVLGSSIVLNTLFLEKYYLYQNEGILEGIAQNVEEILAGNLIEERLFEIDRNYQVSIEILNDELEVVHTSYSMNEAFRLEDEVMQNQMEPSIINNQLDRESSNQNNQGETDLMNLLPQPPNPLNSNTPNPLPNTGNVPSLVNPPINNQNNQTHHLITTNLNELDTSHVYTLLEGVGESGAIVAYIKRTQGGEYIVITSPMQPIDINMDIMNEFYLVSGGVGLIIGWLFIVQFSKQFTKPITSISNIAKKMANLDFQEKIHYPYNNELGELSKSINFLSEQLEENIQALQEEIEFQKLLSRNASHELKTPIAILKGYAEGIYYGITDSPEQERQYLEIMINECDRMDLLVKEMLTLSKLSSQESSAYPMKEFQAILMKEQIEQVFEPLMQQKGIDFRTKVEASRIYGNIDLLVQSVYNFLSNAMKYGDGQIVSFTIEERIEHTYLEVYNTGSSIEEKEMKKIFNLFYTVDQARTREKNAHGLGLSIVQSIAELHQGEVSCRNQRGGITFCLKIPKGNLE